MFTVCPKCALTLVVTAADLRVAQGYVRCGRCSSVFNALAQLTEERHSAAAAAQPTPPPAPPPAAASQTTAPDEPPAHAAAPAPSPEPAAPVEPEAPPTDDSDEEPIPEESLEFNPEKTDVTSVFVEPPPNPQWAAATGSFKALIAANQEELASSAAEFGSPEPISAAPASKAAEPAEARRTPPPDPPQQPDPEQVDVELDARFLADIVLGEAGAGASHPAPAAPAAPPTGPLAPPVEPVSAERAAPSSPPKATPPAPSAPSTPPRKQHARPAAEALPTPGPPPQPPGRGTERAAERTAEHTPERKPERAPRPAPEQLARPEAPPETAVTRLRTGFVLEPANLRVTVTWAIGSVLLLLVLGAQVVNHQRNTLATDPRYNGPLTRLYAALGVPLVPRWDLHAYDVRQLGAAAESGSAGRITVRASVRNGGTRPQPLPLLRVTLQDRFGNRIASRDVLPREYLRRAPAGALMSADERVDAQMTFVDPGTSAVGFELDACLPVDGGVVACANDISAR